ncbi:hypothetical protein MTO96_032433 [Rhipicephalus appendiculatus]
MSCRLKILMILILSTRPDFDAKTIYMVHWTDAIDSDNTGNYHAQILRLGGKHSRLCSCEAAFYIGTATFSHGARSTEDLEENPDFRS